MNEEGEVHLTEGEKKALHALVNGAEKDEVL